MGMANGLRGGPIGDEEGQSVDTAPKAIGGAETFAAVGGLSEIDHRRQLRRAVIASAIGTTIEWYDFVLYGMVTGLVFAKLYFPQSEPLTVTLQSYTVFFVGFVARPVGAFVFGHFGDRLGRKRALIATLLLTGVATFAVALVPSYEHIGIWGAIILVLLRFIQGIGVGGEWGGAVLLSMEWAQTNSNRGFVASWPQFGAPFGIALATAALLFFSWLSGDQFLIWGWRVPFLLSIVMVGVGLYVRLGISETPIFARVLAENRVERLPAVEVIRRQPKELILTSLARMTEQAPSYIYNTYIFTYGTAVLGASRDFLLVGVLAMSVLGFVWLPIAGHLSDRIGRKRLYIIAAAISGIFGFVYFAMLNTRAPAWVFVAIVLSILPIATLYGPQAALIAESFSPRFRYSGAGLGYQLAAIVAGGPAPFIATALYATYHSGYAIAFYILGCGVISMAATALLKDHTNKDIAEEYDKAPVVTPAAA
jgi:MFS family permease